MICVLLAINETNSFGFFTDERFVRDHIKFVLPYYIYTEYLVWLEDVARKNHLAFANALEKIIELACQIASLFIVKPFQA